ncbi:MAG TPA: tetratricopeptide repeat protein [Fimbriimonas sp.]
MDSLRWRTWLFLCLAASGALPAVVPAQPKSVPKKDYLAEPTHWGAVQGRVYDAETGKPIPKAQISIQGEDGGFLDSGRSTARTDGLGLYKAQAVLGRISHNFDIGRALTSGVVGVLLGGATNTTKRLDVTRLNLRVLAEGYRSYLGPVDARWIDAKLFTIQMQPVLLVREGSPYESTMASGWGVVKITEAAAQPPIAHPGEKLTLTAKVVTFDNQPDKKLEVRAVSRLWGGDDRKLNPVKGSPGQYSITLDVDKKARVRAEVVTVYIAESSLDVSMEGQRKRLLVQVATDAPTEEVAKARAAAFAEYVKDPVSSLRTYEKLVADGGTNHDFQFAYNLALRSGDYATAKAASTRMLERVKKEEKPEQRDRAFAVLANVRALYLAKDYREAVDAAEAEIKLYKRKEWANKIYPSVPAYQGMSYIKLGDLDKAAQVNEDMAAWSSAGGTVDATEFREALRMAQVEKALEMKPKDPNALADYGRALIDRGRYEEGVAKLKAALAEDPKAVAVARDLAWAGLQLGSKSEVENLDQAVEEAKTAVKADDPKRGSKDFFGWSKYVALLYAKTARDAGDETFGPEYDPVIAALRQSVKLGRMGQEVNEGFYLFTFGYLSPSRVAISGYAYSEADACFQMLDALRRLRLKPDDYLARYGLAYALTDLGQTNLATQQLDRVVRQHPDFNEATHLQARIAMREKDDAAAIGLLRKVLERNPRHPRANLDLAEALTRTGDVAGAAESMAAHAKWYGEASE